MWQNNSVTGSRLYIAIDAEIKILSMCFVPHLNDMGIRFYLLDQSYYSNKKIFQLNFVKIYGEG